MTPKSLKDILYSKSKLYLIFEYVEKDLKAYMDSGGSLSLDLIRVISMSSFIHPVLELHDADAPGNRFLSLSSNFAPRFETTESTHRYQRKP